MSHRLLVRSEAETDITEAALWYEGREAGLGLELTAEIRGAIQRAVERPLTYLRLRKHPEIAGSLRGDFRFGSSSLCELTRSLFSLFSTRRVTTATGKNGYEREQRRRPDPQPFPPANERPTEYLLRGNGP